MDNANKMQVIGLDSTDNLPPQRQKAKELYD